MVKVCNRTSANMRIQFIRRSTQPDQISVSGLLKSVGLRHVLFFFKAQFAGLHNQLPQDPRMILREPSPSNYSILLLAVHAR